MTSSRRSDRALPAIAVLCSGQGTNLQALLDATRRGTLAARVVLVLSDRADAKALVRARQAGITAQFVDPKKFAGRADHEGELIRLCDEHRVSLVCLAGYMRMLSGVFVGRYRHGSLNVHPPLLPAFPGAPAIRDALSWGARVTGVTVHFVDEEMDHGPIILQEAVPIKAGDTEATLLARVHRVEHRLYAKTVGLVLAARVRVDGRRVRLRSKSKA